MRFHPTRAAIQVLLALSFMQTLYAQNQIAGIVHDASGRPVPFANALLVTASDSTLLRALFTSEQGGFQFDNLPAGNYLVRISMLGFDQVFSRLVSLNGMAGRIDLEPTVLQESATALSELQVIARRPLLEQKIDRTVVNVANSITNAGSTALEVLERSPGVQVDMMSKSISLSGKEGVLIMINGKLQRLPADAVVQMLAGLNANNIDHIELIHTPPANFEAEGNAGIINIVLKNTGDEGLNGGYSANAGYGFGLKTGMGAYFNYRRSKLNLYGGYDWNLNQNPQVFTNYRGIQQGADFLETDNTSDRYYTSTPVQNARLGLDFQVSPKTIIGILGSFFDSKWHMDALGSAKNLKNGELQSLVRMPNSEINHHRSFSGNINITHRISKTQTLSLDADIVNYDMNNPSSYQVEYLDATGALTSQNELRINKKTPVDVAVGKADYSLQMGENIKLESGAKFTALRFDNDVQVDSREPGQDWLNMSDLSSFSHLQEYIAGAYVVVSSKLDKKTDLKSGVRYEYTDTKLGSPTGPNLVDRQYGNWFPSIFLTRQLSETRSINASYSRRISRPQIQQLAPWLIFQDPSTLMGGNPAVQPSFTDAFNLGYIIKSWRLGMSYSKVHRPVVYVPNIDVENNRQLTRPENLGSKEILSMDLSVPFHPAKWWDIQTNFFVNSNRIFFELEGEKIRLQNIGYGFNITQTLNFHKGFSLEISGDYTAPGYFGIAYWQATGSLNFGLQKDFGEKWGKLRLAATDVLLSTTWRGYVDQPEINLHTANSFRFSERVLKLSWTNTFGNKSLKSSRQRQTGSEDEMKRL